MHTWRERLGIELNEVSYKEKLISALGGGIAIFLLVLFGQWGLDGTGGHCVVASMGASAVLLFAVPHGQLSQPWPVIAGHGFSALVGVICAKYISNQELAAACAVGLAIGMMHQFKCIHPPGGATALTAVIGGQTIHDLGYNFVIFPVMINASIMVSLAILINASFHWRRYPAFLIKKTQSLQAQSGPSHEEVVAALKSLDSFVDITEEDLVRLTQMLAPKNKAAQEKKKAAFIPA
jgi:CBS domain-containing membrane protein